MERLAEALDLELYQLSFVGAGKPQAPQVATMPPEPRLGLQAHALLKLFGRMTKPDQRLLLDMARKMTDDEEAGFGDQSEGVTVSIQELSLANAVPKAVALDPVNFHL